MKSSTVKKALFEETIKLSAMARKHIQNHERNDPEAMLLLHQTTNLKTVKNIVICTLTNV